MDDVRRSSEAPLPETIEGLRRQNSAYRVLCASLEARMGILTEKGREYQEAVTTLESEREANAILTAENARLTEERDALASILDGAIKDERIDEIDRIANYKYFGEYELSDTQLDATLDAIYALNAIKRMRAIQKGE